MKPWIALETLKLLLFLGFGIALIAMSAQWARELGTFIANVSSSSGYTVNATEEYLRMQLIAQGAGLIIAVLIGGYFLFVVISHHNNVKNGVGADEEQDVLRPPVHGVLMPPDPRRWCFLAIRSLHGLPPSHAPPRHA